MKFKHQAIFLFTLMIMALFLTSCGGLTKNRVATFDTSQGTIKIELFEDNVPITTKNFIDLAEKGFYDGTKFHRVINGFMIQGGDPLSKDDSKMQVWGTGGPGYAIKDEFHSELSNVKGTISMANHGPNTGGSQFFINLVDNTFLDHNKQPLQSKHPVFGKVIDGMNIIEKIGQLETDPTDKPIKPVIIESITIK